MKSVLILYFSGVGSTKKIAELIYNELVQSCKVDISSIESKNIPNINSYDALVVGTPTYHAAPAKIMMSYLDALPPFRTSKYNNIPKANKTVAFIYNTCGLCSLNTNRILAKKLQEKNIATIIDKAYRSPASDGSILAPFIKRFFEFEKDICKKINSDCAEFVRLLNNGNSKPYIPTFKLASIINGPNKAAGQFFTLKLHLHKNKCSKCGYCIKKCPHSAFSMGAYGYPLFNSKKCENCYRCVHHCPHLALSPWKRKEVKRSLGKSF